MEHITFLQRACHGIGGISVSFTCFSVTDGAAAAPASSSHPSTTKQTQEKPSSHVVGMCYMYVCVKFSEVV